MRRLTRTIENMLGRKSQGNENQEITGRDLLLNESVEEEMKRSER